MSDALSREGDKIKLFYKVSLATQRGVLFLVYFWAPHELWFCLTFRGFALLLFLEVKFTATKYTPTHSKL
jgi:hypothetical protein